MGKKKEDRKKDRNVKSSNLRWIILAVIIILVAAGVSFYFQNSPSSKKPTTNPKTHPKTNPKTPDKRDNPSQTKAPEIPAEWDQTPIWSVINPKKDPFVFSKSVNSAGYSRIKVHETIPAPLTIPGKYGVERIRYLVLEPSIAVQGVSCLRCDNETGFCRHFYNRDQLSIIPPCMFEPNQGMLGIAAAVPSSLDCLKPSKVAMLGLGNGAMSGYIEFFFPEWSVDIVEINDQLASPEILNLLGNHPNSSHSHTTVFVEDAKEYVTRQSISCEPRYDLILADLCASDSSPPFLADPDWALGLSCMLKSNGLLIFNLLGFLSHPNNQKQLKDHIATIKNIMNVFGSNWNYYFTEVGGFNRLFFVTKASLKDKDLKQLAAQESQRCSTPLLRRGFDFLTTIDDSSPNSETAWIANFSSFQTRVAYQKLSNK